ncbi:hypothetical protein C2E25_00720 [Geothermobacter hydrogeniphilus]|uniref:Uncharacterized protein n=1 Tax=Geothermobacter hydrogeniphilus TaxID=1969733 RepID=A0A2K2HER3_9BACT|nr:hypothetical protein [Geothermobacter hydrogeniphilus]PNU21785.1 hypothetical protein C2E25_00720 [Geothermobacter hydrogeniphilus]
MRRTILTLLLLSILLVAPAFGKHKNRPHLPVGTLNGEQIRLLFADKTVESITAVKHRVSLTYYAPNGDVRQLRKGIKRFGHWRVTKNGRMCLQMEGLREKCRIIVKENGTYKKYIVKKNGRHQHTVTYRSFKPGNPLGL